MGFKRDDQTIIPSVVGETGEIVEVSIRKKSKAISYVIEWTDADGNVVHREKMDILDHPEMSHKDVDGNVIVDSPANLEFTNLLMNYPAVYAAIKEALWGHYQEKTGVKGVVD